MDVEITPEPSDRERHAILEALRGEDEGLQPPSPWRRAALEPLEEDDDYATAPLRHSRGATRA